jgi:virulence-associated protein VapD
MKQVGIVAAPEPCERKYSSDPRALEGRRYAITLDLNFEALRDTYEDPCDTAFCLIHQILENHGFTRQQDGVYFGGSQINAVTCVMAALDLSRQLPWFAASVRDIRMLRIEELNDLMPAIQQAQE